MGSHIIGMSLLQSSMFWNCLLWFGAIFLTSINTNEVSLVSKNVGNYHEIIEDESGILCDLSSDSIKKEIVSITENPSQLNRLSINAFLTTKKRYSLRLVVKELIHTYKQIYKNR